MTAEHIPPTVIDSLTAAYHAVDEALTRADQWNRNAVSESAQERIRSASVARQIADIRFRLGDLLAEVMPPTVTDSDGAIWEPGETHAFTNATERGE